MGSRRAGLHNYDLIEPNLPQGITLIISGGAAGADGLAKLYAQQHNISLQEILPNYAAFGRLAPILRNNQIVRQADFVLCLWDGKSKGTGHVLSLCMELGKPCKVVPI